MADAIHLDYLERANPCDAFDAHVSFYDVYEDPVTSAKREHVYLVQRADATAQHDRAPPSPEIYDYSVTTFVHAFFPRFDADAVADRIVRGKRWKNDPSYQYYRMPAETIKASWSQSGAQASSLGTLMHANIEKFYNHPTLWSLKSEASLMRELPKHFTPAELATPELAQFFRFHLDGPAQWNWSPWRTELRVFDRDLRVAGSVDMLYKSPSYTDDNRLLVMLDWKRSKEISKVNNYKERGFPPVQDLPHANYYQYSLQLNVYKRIIELNTPYVIEYMALGVFHPNFQAYQVHPVPAMPDHVDKIWAARMGRIRQMVPVKM